MNGVNHKELTRDISHNLAPLRAHNANVMQGFGALNKAAMTPGIPDEKTKELIAWRQASPTVATAALAFTRRHWCAWARRPSNSARCPAWPSTWAAARR